MTIRAEIRRIRQDYSHSSIWQVLRHRISTHTSSLMLMHRRLLIYHNKSSIAITVSCKRMPAYRGKTLISNPMSMYLDRCHHIGGDNRGRAEAMVRWIRSTSMRRYMEASNLPNIDGIFTCTNLNRVQVSCSGYQRSAARRDVWSFQGRER